MKLLSDKELKAALWLLPLLAAGCTLAWMASFPRKSDKRIASLEAVVDSIAAHQPELFEFDPNTVEFFDLCRLGLERNQALAVIKYRERGKVFEIAEDFASCYAIDESTFVRLRPYIKIGEEYALKRFEQKPTPKRIESKTPKRAAERFAFMPDTAGIATFMRLGFSPSQAENIIKYRELIGGFHSSEEFEKCYMVSEEIAAELRPYAFYEPVPKPTTSTKTDATELPIELNSADSATLCKVVGIGPKSAAAIIAYREKLGGFHSAEQLAQVWQVTEQNYERILSQIWVDSCGISKININFAPAKELAGHPYFTPKLIRKLLKERQLKGGWCSQEDFLNDKILTTQEAKNIVPYLIFRCDTNQ